MQKIKTTIYHNGMIKFIGEYKARTDDKGRIVFPAAFKALIDADGQPALVVKKDIFSPCLNLYTYSEWERESEEIKSRLNFFRRDHAKLWRKYMSQRAVVEPDGKIGRISIPRQLLDSIGVDRDVVFAGNDHKIELWAKEKYEESRMTDDEFLALAEKILG